MEGFVKGEAPGIDDEVAREQSALGKLITVSNYWHAEAGRRGDALQRLQVRAAARFSSFVVTFFAGLAAGGALHYLGVW